MFASSIALTFQPKRPRDYLCEGKRDVLGGVACLLVACKGVSSMVFSTAVIKGAPEGFITLAVI